MDKGCGALPKEAEHVLSAALGDAGGLLIADASAQARSAGVGGIESGKRKILGLDLLTWRRSNW